MPTSAPQPDTDADTDADAPTKTALDILREPGPDWTEWLSMRVRRDPRRSAAVAAVLCVLVAVGAFAFTRSEGEVDLPSLPMTGRARGTSTTARRSDTTAGAVPPGSSVVSIWVSVAGAVAQPGLVAVRDGARVAEVVQRAGGFSADADPDRVNLAAKVRDGERVYVPRRGEAAAPPIVAGGGGETPPTSSGGSGGASGSGPTSSGPVDLNTATADDLDRLPGIGPATAAAILAYREQHGPFRNVDELADVRGIGPAKLEQLRPLVTVG